MAKNSDPLAGAFETEKDGFLSGFLAEEDELDRRGLWRIGAWGVGAVAAVVAAVWANQMSLNLRRDLTASADIAQQAQQVQLFARESQNEARRLAAAVETLNGDRDRLFARVTVLEQGLDSMTGAIARPTNPPPSQPAKMGPPAEPPPPIQPQAAAPALSPVGTAPTILPERPRVALTEPGQPSPITAPPAAGTLALDPRPATAASLVAPKSMLGPPDPAAGKLAEPPKTAKLEVKSDVRPPQAVAAVPQELVKEPAKDVVKETAPKDAAPKDVISKDVISKDEASKDVASKDVATKDLVSKDLTSKEDAPSEPESVEAALPKVPVQRTEFAVDLGAANSIGGLRALWRGLSKSNAALAALQPIIVVREGNTGFGMQLRLAAGPLTDAASAAQICAPLVASDRICDTTVFDGQRLAMKEDEAVKAAHKRGYYPRRAKKEEPPPAPLPPKADASTLSRFFGSK
jgi:hypothetical protein